MTSNFTEKIDHFICDFPAVDFYFFSVFYQILEEVSVLLSKHVTLLVNLKEVWKLWKNVRIKFGNQTNWQSIEPRFQCVDTSKSKLVVQLTEAKCFDHYSLP